MKYSCTRLRGRCTRIPKLVLLVVCFLVYELLSLLSPGGLLDQQIRFWQPQSTKDSPKKGRSVFELFDSEDEEDEHLSSPPSVAKGEWVPKVMDFNPRPGVEKKLVWRFNKCDHRCGVTSRVEEADVIMFDAEFIWNTTLPPRKPGQIWLLYTREPPTHRPFSGLARPDLIDVFNWTNTIFRDSTFQTKYGRILKRRPPVKNYDKVFKKKQHEVAWFVGHCPTQSRREDYANLMSKEISVHIYGLCGNYTCGAKGYTMGGAKEECLSMLSQKYKFYLSFENALCRDYVTEKVYNMYLEDIDVIPVVRGAAKYDQLLPAGTYINTDDFASPQELGRYLKKLSKDKDKYLAMLKKKDKFRAIGCCHFHCDLCDALHADMSPSVYHNVSRWFSAQDNCRVPTDYNWRDRGPWMKKAYYPQTHPIHSYIKDDP